MTGSEAEGAVVVQQHMQIGEVADRTGLSINTIRHYDHEGLVKPSARSQGGFRLYTDNDVERLLVIKRMKPLGFSLEQMAELLDATTRLGAGTKMSRASRKILCDTIRRYQDLTAQRRDQLAREIAVAEEFGAMLEKLAKLDHRPA